MFFNDSYHYYLCDSYSFNSSYLNTKEYKKLKKYVLVFYKKENKLLQKKIYSMCELKNFEEKIIIKYYIEELDLTGTYFESEYTYCKIYNISGIGVIKKVLFEKDFIEDDDNEIIKKMIYDYDKNYNDNLIDENEFFKM